jgi:hypothetical protein
MNTTKIVDSIFIDVVIITVSLILGIFIGYRIRNSNLEKHLIEINRAEYVINKKTGERTLVWTDTKKPIESK